MEMRWSQERGKRRLNERRFGLDRQEASGWKDTLGRDGDGGEKSFERKGKV
jgi:hypothetical protein